MTFNEFMSKLGDMFLDQNDGVDDKRVLGVPIIVAAVVYVLIAGKDGLPVFAAVAGLGTTLLLGAIAGDQGKLGTSKTSGNGTSGIPGS